MNGAKATKGQNIWMRNFNFILFISNAELNHSVMLKYSFKFSLGFYYSGEIIEDYLFLFLKTL